MLCALCSCSVALSRCSVCCSEQDFSSQLPQALSALKPNLTNHGDGDDDGDGKFDEDNNDGNDDDEDNDDDAEHDDDGLGSGSGRGVRAVPASGAEESPTTSDALPYTLLAALHCTVTLLPQLHCTVATILPAFFAPSPKITFWITLNCVVIKILLYCSALH